MYSLGLLTVASCLLALLLTPIVRGVARRMGWMDPPGDPRKVHRAPVPRVGGIAILLAYIGAFAVLILAGFSATGMVRSGLPMVRSVLPAVGLMFAVGLFDDIWGLEPWQKYCGQLAAAGLAVWGGVHVTGFANVEFPMWATVPLTLLWLTGCANAFNLIDGVDGLAAGLGFFATVTMLLAGLLGNNIPLVLATAPLAGALLGFLRYNFNPATIFLGDSGSLTIGFLLGCFGAVWSQKSATVLGMTAPLMALAIPLLDTALAMVRRFLRMQPIWGADRGHIHHRLLDRGWSPRRAALTLYSVAAIGALFSITQSTTQAASYGGIVIVLFCVGAWMGVQHLGYVEFGVAGRMFMDGAFRRQLKAQLNLQSFRLALEKAKSPEECWRTICRASEEFGCANARIRIAGIDFGDCQDVYPLPGAWQIHIPLPGDDFVSLERQVQDGRPDGVAAFANAICEVLLKKVPEFERVSLPRTFAAQA